MRTSSVQILISNTILQWKELGILVEIADSRTEARNKKKTHNLILTIRKTSEKPQLRNILQNSWAGLKNIYIIKKNWKSQKLSQAGED